MIGNRCDMNVCEWIKTNGYGCEVADWSGVVAVNKCGSSRTVSHGSREAVWLQPAVMDEWEKGSMCDGLLMNKREVYKP